MNLQSKINNTIHTVSAISTVSRAIASAQMIATKQEESMQRLNILKNSKQNQKRKFADYIQGLSKKMREDLLKLKPHEKQRFMNEIDKRGNE